MNKDIKKLLKDKGGIRLDIGGGIAPQKGFVSMDYQDLPGIDIVHNWDDFPWPLPDESVLTAIASHVVEHVNPVNGHFIKWLDEVWRVLKPDGQIAIAAPYGGSPGYWQDPTHCNGVTETTWHYFDPLSETGLYRFYEPAPWKIEVNTYDQSGNVEVVLRKRRDDVSYHQDGKNKYGKKSS